MFLLAGPGASGRTPGWRPALYRAPAGRDGAAVACPPRLYEDWSVRYAGSAELEFQDIAPDAPPQAQVPGMPAGPVASQTPVPAVSGTLECCALRRPALAALDGAGVLSTDAGREADFFLRLRKTGLAGAWVPSVQVCAPEDGAEIQGQAGRIVDKWMLREAWRPAASPAVTLAGRE